MKYNILKIFSSVSLLILILNSCIDQSYDLDNMDKNISLGGDAFMIPLGSTAQITIDNLLKGKQYDNFLLLEDGSYAITLTGNRQISMDQIHDYEFDFGDIFERDRFETTINIPAPPSIPLPGIPIPLDEISIDLSNTYNISIDLENIPDIIVGIDSIYFANTSMTIELQLSEIPLVSYSSKEIEYTITLPEGVTAASDGVVIEDNILTGTKELSDNKISISMDLLSIKMDPAISSENSSIYLDFPVSAYYRIDDPIVDLDNLNGTQIYADYVLSIQNSQVAKAFGEIDFTTEDISFSLELEQIPDMMIGDDFVLDFAAGGIMLDFSTNVGIPLSAQATLTPSINGQVNQDGVQDIDLKISRSLSSDQYETSSFWLSSSDSDMPQGYTFKEMSLNELINPIPESLAVELVASADNNVLPHILDFNADYGVEIDYQLMLPLSFGEDLDIYISDTLKNIPPVVTTLLKNNAIRLTGEITNSFPFNLQLVVTALDENKESIKDVSISQLTVSGSTSNGSPVTTDVNIALNANIKDDVEIKSLLLNFYITNPKGNTISIDKDDFVQAKFSVKLEGGLNTDISDFTKDLLEYEK